VIIRCNDAKLDDEVVMDAAALAARQSKCQGTVIKVSMTRAHNVKKPPNAKPGLVQLTGSVRTVTVHMNQVQSRLERLDKTVLIN
jgi:predicted ribosome quality control (RQC) complex YloA/Tae2 family protein